MQIAHSLSTEAFTNYTFLWQVIVGYYVRNWTPMQRLSCFIYEILILLERERESILR